MHEKDLLADENIVVDIGKEKIELEAYAVK